MLEVAPLVQSNQKKRRHSSPSPPLYMMEQFLSSASLAARTPAPDLRLYKPSPVPVNRLKNKKDCVLQINTIYFIPWSSKGLLLLGSIPSGNGLPLLVHEDGVGGVAHLPSPLLHDELALIGDVLLSTVRTPDGDSIARSTLHSAVELVKYLDT